MLNKQKTFQTASNVKFTDHALSRKRQRGIKDLWISLVLEFGQYIYQKGKHTYTVSLEKGGVRQIQRTYGDLVELTKLRRMYLVLSEDSVVITCAYR